jgi:hypothetical protein
MVMYGWSPNWLATSHGHEPYNLYIRRSFDGGVTWTTTPASLGGDGTTYDQVNGVGERVWTETRVLGAGEFEPARNVSQLTTNKETILDPALLADQPRHPDERVADPPRRRDLPDPVDDRPALRPAGSVEVLRRLRDRRRHGGADRRRSRSLGPLRQPRHQVRRRLGHRRRLRPGRGIWEERWDWIENKDEVRSGESSMGASPGRPVRLDRLERVDAARDRLQR